MKFFIKNIIAGIIIGLTFMLSLKYVPYEKFYIKALPPFISELIPSFCLSIIWGVVNEKSIGKKLLSATIAFVVSTIAAVIIMVMLISSVWS